MEFLVVPSASPPLEHVDEDRVTKTRSRNRLTLVIALALISWTVVWIAVVLAGAAMGLPG